MTSSDLMVFQGSPNQLAKTKKPTDKIDIESLPVVVQSWLTQVKRKSPNSHDAYHLSISLWLRWCIANGVDPAAPELEDAEAWAAHLQASKEEGGRGNSERTANARCSAVSSLYNRLIATKRITYNPFPALVFVKIDRDDAETPAISEGDVKKMLRVVAKDPHKAHAAVMELLFTNGARASEIGSANVEDLTSDDYGKKLHVTRKGGKKQRIPVTPKALKAIEIANADRGSLPATAPLLVGERGKRYSRHTISRLVHRTAIAANINPDVAKLVTAHTTRRSAATALADKGTDIRTIQILLGHKDPRTTEGYIRAKDDREKQAAAALTLSSLFH